MNRDPGNCQVVRIKRALPDADRATALVAELAQRAEDAVLYTREHFEDPAEILDRTWIDD